MTVLKGIFLKLESTFFFFKVSHGSRAGEVEVIKNVVEPEEKRGAKKVAFEHDKSYSPSAYKVCFGVFKVLLYRFVNG
jgi:hypothetical protein